MQQKYDNKSDDTNSGTSAQNQKKPTQDDNRGSNTGRGKGQGGGKGRRDGSGGGKGRGGGGQGGRRK